ncbi:tyrosine-type recombinase/integrase [Streptomyces scabiei]|uniref:tyrosine-type recombinase/integrase n=1 Tax=Streptomyces scabiei TaxID=1930 RepID=UPI0029BB1D4E|nr:tyrosine-type recombinase/integrase [Streptomyces scabiei]MDX2580323.1 tyrosine-type recombinase/integrase [Streptomyces scabiei]MDX2725994.1 tyrosine-type recombinase/integrase [Streptomyces scabiei]MDX2893302.1 tyrosine-type recombinase/integrase [Streptomyces scabiei]MDX2901320.1 tyrosine-type recombinase/integrase [Streptomyces scabiei]MDX2994624.1 tyrosine-type recombinase/integrase [Streptomyces scabiei]
MTGVDDHYVLAPGNTHKDALTKLTEKIAASNRGLPVATADSTVSAYLVYWLEGVAVHHLRENTHTRYAASIRLHLNPGLGAKKLARLTTRDVRTFLDGLRTTCQCCAQGRDTDRRSCCAIGQCCEKRLSPLTVTYVHAVLKSALEHAVHEDELPRNVARNIKTTAPRPRRFQPLTATEARQLLQAANGDRLHALYELALRTGLRKGELLGLHWEDVDLDGGTATIHRSLQRTRSQGLTVLNTKTLASERRIALPTECLSSLKIHQEQQQEERQAAGTNWADNGLVFTTPKGKPLDPTNLTRRFRRLLHSSGLRTIRFHDLRHSTATLLLEQGIDLVVIKELLGHAHIGVTAGVYAHVRLRLQRQAINTLNDLLGTGNDDREDPPSTATVR